MALVEIIDPGSPMIRVWDDVACKVVGWKIRTVAPPENLTPVYDPGSYMVALVDEKNCVKSWAVRVQPAPE